MVMSNVLKLLNEELYIIESNVFKIYSHKTGNVVGKEYTLKEEAVSNLLKYKTNGDFTLYSKFKQNKMIKNYITKHNL